MSERRLYTQAEARERRTNLLNRAALDLVAARATRLEEHHSLELVQADLYVYRAAPHGPTQDRIDQQWTVTFSEQVEDSYHLHLWQWYISEWDPAGEALSLFAAFCEPEDTPDPKNVSTLGHVATFTRPDLKTWVVQEHEPKSPERDGLLSQRAIELDRFNESGEMLPTDGVIRQFNATQTEQMRQELIQNVMKPYATEVFESLPELRSAVALVAQFWNDEAIDEVHMEWRFSVDETPSMEPEVWRGEYGMYTGVDDPDLPGDVEQFDIEQLHPFWRTFHSGEALPAIAAFCPEGGDQNRDDCFAPFAILRRTPAGVAHEFVGTILRPWLDGIASGMSTDRPYPDVPRGYDALLSD